MEILKEKFFRVRSYFGFPMESRCRFWLAFALGTRPFAGGCREFLRSPDGYAQKHRALLGAVE